MVGLGSSRLLSLEVLVDADFLAWVFSLRITVMMSPTRLALTSANRDGLVPTW